MESGTPPRDTATAMAEDVVDTVRLPIAAAAQSRRRVWERLAVRFPSAVALLVRTTLRLRPTSRLRQSLVRRFMREGVEALNRGDYETVFCGFYAPDCEFDPGPRFRSLGMEQTHGREDRIRFQEQWIAEWGDFRFEPAEVIDFGDGRLMVRGRVRGIGPSSGAAIDDEWATLLTLSAGRAVREQAFFDDAEAREAVGLSE
jgi:ketosteroid isomerase-like protein